MYGFIYITTNTINGKRYLGQRKYSNGWKSYLGSGKSLSKAIEKYGKSNFKREIIKEVETPEELNRLEYEFSRKYNVVKSRYWYNQCYGGGATNGFKFSEESKRKLSNSLKGKMKGERNPMYGVSIPCSEEKKRMLSKRFSGKGNNMYNVHLTYEKNPRARKVYCVELNKVYNCAKKAAHELNINYSNIIAVCKGKRKTVGGYTFQYVNTEIIKGTKEPLTL